MSAVFSGVNTPAMQILIYHCNINSLLKLPQILKLALMHWYKPSESTAGIYIKGSFHGLRPCFVFDKKKFYLELY